jgi:hypothetical protein
MKRKAIAALAAMPVAAVVLAGSASADTDPDYLAALSAAGVPVADPVAAGYVAADVCSHILSGTPLPEPKGIIEDLSGGGDPYWADVATASGGIGRWTPKQRQAVADAARKYYCPPN